MRTTDRRLRVRRREFLRGPVATAPVAAAVAAVGAGMTPEAAWAAEAKALQPRTVAVLVRAARDIYPHDHLADRYYVAAIAAFDAEAAEKPSVRVQLDEGAALLDREARARFGRDYLGVRSEEDRVQVLKAVQSTPFFHLLRGDLVTKLYNQKDLWAKFGYEGESYSKGGYLERGFDDIDWLSQA